MNKGYFVDEPRCFDSVGGWVVRIPAAWEQYLLNEVMDFNNTCPNGRQGCIEVRELTERDAMMVNKELEPQRGRSTAVGASKTRSRSRTFSELMETGRGYHGKMQKQQDEGF